VKSDKSEFDVMIEEMCKVRQTGEKADEKERLAAEKKSATLRSMLADWCEDHHRHPEAECLRWAVKNGKRCYSDGGQGAWFNAKTIAPGMGDPESDLPEELYKQLEGGATTANHMNFESAELAERKLLSAWAKAREAGWAPGE
jgi:hypothetical protein